VDTEPVPVAAVVGRSVEGDWPGRLRDASVDVLRLDQSDAQKSRLRRATEGGVEVAISLERGVRLQDGDILAWDADRRSAIVARIDLNEVLVIELTQLRDEPVEVAMARCVELGHALGNQHWPAVIKRGRVYVPAVASQPVMASVMKTHSFEGVTYGFMAGQEVIPYLAPHEARRLFGGAAGHSHLEGQP
jgi:urease accessory protein